MKKIIRFSSRHPVLVFIFILIITGLAATQLSKLKFSIAAESMMIEDKAEVAFYRQTLETFGTENMIILFLGDKDLFSPHKLKNIQLTVEKIKTLSFVERVESIFSIQNVRTVNDNVRFSPYLETIPDSTAAAEKIAADAQLNPFIESNLLSLNKHALAINIYFNNESSSPEFDQFSTQEIEYLIAPLKTYLETTFQMGSSTIRAAISNKIIQDQSRVFPLALFVLLITLGLMLRRVSGVIIPLITAGISVVWTLGLMAALDIPINIMTAIVPALLVIIGSTEDIHLFSEYRSGISRGLNHATAIDRMGNKMAIAIGLTFFTTYLGFLSISLNSLHLLKEFGLVASTALLLNFLITLLVVPALLEFFAHFGSGKQASGENAGSDDSVIQRVTIGFFHFIQRHRVATVIVSLLILLIALIGASSLRVNNNALDYFDKESPIIQKIHTLENSLAGIQTFSIVLDSGIEGTFLKVRYLEEIEKLQQYLSRSGIADKTLSFADYLSVIDRSMNGEQGEDLYLPEDDLQVQEYMLFVKHEQVKSFVSEDYSQARILVRHSIGSSHELGEALEKIQQFSQASLDAGLHMQTTGQSVLSAKAADYLATAQAKSLMLMVFVIFIIVALLFVNSKVGMIAVIPNLFPIIVLFGVMGATGIALDTGTAMTAAIAIGICVDDTLHFMIRYHENSKTEKNEQKVLEQTVREESTPIVSTSIALAFGFAALGLSSFPPIAHFGLLSALVMLMALVATFVITPTLLSYTKLITVWDLLSVRVKSEVIENCKLFTGMRPSQIKKTILLSDIQTFEKGEKVIAKGDASGDLFVILEGSADAVVSLSGENSRLRNMQTGEIFGEIALLLKSPRTADVIAAEKLKVLAIDWESIASLNKVYPRISSKLFHNISSIMGDRLVHGAES